MTEKRKCARKTIASSTKSKNALGSRLRKRVALEKRWPRADEPLVHVHHEGGAEQRRREIQDRDRHEGRDEEPGSEDRRMMQLAQRLGLLDRMEAHRDEQEIFAAEQIGVGHKEDQEAEPGEQHERH